MSAGGVFRVTTTREFEGQGGPLRITGRPGFAEVELRGNVRARTLGETCEDLEEMRDVLERALAFLRGTAGEAARAEGRTP